MFPTIGPNRAAAKRSAAPRAGASARLFSQTARRGRQIPSIPKCELPPSGWALDGSQRVPWTDGYRIPNLNGEATRSVPETADRQETERTEAEEPNLNRKDHPMQHLPTILARKMAEDPTRQTSRAANAIRAQNPLRATRTCNKLPDVYK